MTIAGKHLDAVMGIDTHVVMIPSPVGAPVPTPLPNPYVGIVMDPLDYVPGIGATVYINGLPRAQAGTGTMQITPHLPLGGPLVPPATGEGEVFMGSMTVDVDGDAQSFLSMPVLTCQTAGMPAPFRPKGAPPKSLVLPTTTLLATPMGMPVMIGGPPTISLMSLGSSAAFAGLGKLGKMIRKAQRGPGALGRGMKKLSRGAHEAGAALAKKLDLGPVARNRIARAVCTVTGHPVDVATGKVFTDHVDLRLPGPIPFELERVWYSTSTYRGPFGHGWHHSYDAALHVTDEVVLYRAPDGRAIAFPPVAAGEERFLPNERLTLLKVQGGYAIRNRQRQLMHFRDVGRDSAEYVLTSIEDPVGHNIVLRYDERGLLTELVDSADRTLGFVYDSQHRICELWTPHPDRPAERVCMARYSYDDRGNLLSVQDALGHPFTYRYRRHLLTQETNRGGLCFYFEYDAETEAARCTRTWGDDGIYDHKLSYDEDNSLTTVTNSLGYKTQHQHQDGLVTRTVDAHGGITLYEYSENDWLLSQTDPLGQATRYSYDDRGNLLTITQPDGAQQQLSYDEHDHCVQMIDAMGGGWSFAYDAQGRLLARTDPTERSIRYRYAGKYLQALIDPTGLPTQVSFDSAGNLTRVALPDGGVHQFEHDRLGRVLARLDPAGNCQRQGYDLLGRVIRVAEPDGNVRELAYDPDGNVVHVKDAQHDVRFAFRGMGRLASRTEAGTTVSFEYDTEEQLTGITNEHGHVYLFQLGPLGELLVESGFDGVRRRYEHDLGGRVTRVERASGLTTAYTYDAAGRVLAVEHSDGTQEQYGYRPDGTLLQAKNQHSTLLFARDALGRITRELQGQHWVQSEYDARGYRVRMTSSMGADQHIERSAMGDVTGLVHQQSDQAQALPFEAHITRDAMGVEIERSLPGGLRSRWVRDSLGRPLQQQLMRGNLPMREREYRWDVGDRLRMIFDSQYGSVRYGHDALGNLASAYFDNGGGRELRMPDAVGNLFRREDRSDREYGAAGQLLKSVDAQGRTTRYTYDPEGNLLQKTRDDGELWQYRWGADGMLKSVVRPDGSEVSFTYDPLGRRISKTYRGQTTRWVWDGNVMLHEWVEGSLQPVAQTGRQHSWMDASSHRREAELSQHLLRGPPERGSRQRPITWLFEPESFTPMAKLVGDERLSVICDHLGVPIAMHDATGTEVWSAQIGTWGDLRRLRTGTAQDCPFRWPGQYEDAETGLYYNRFRYYDPEGGQYVAQDPIGLAGGTAVYDYTRDPLGLADPLGLSACVPSDPRVAEAIAAGRPIVIVGRRMSRVNPVAEALRAEGGVVRTYNPRNFRSTDGAVDSADIEANRAWLRYWAKDKGALVVDIGDDPRTDLISPFYEVEKRSLYHNWMSDVVRYDPGF